MLEKGGRHRRRQGLPVPARKHRVPLALGGILLIAAAGGVIEQIVTANSPIVSTANSLISSPCQNMVVPAYFYPGAGWTTAADSKPVPRIMILDVAGPGAGSAPQRKYQAAVKRAQAAGITIMGYSDTDYTQRPPSDIEADVRNYKAWYGVTDIFLDQVSSGQAQLGYYRSLARYIHGVNPGSAVMLNPGTYPDQQYMSVGDIVMVFENTYASYVSLQVPGWVHKYPATRFAYVIYGTSGSQLASAISLAQKRHAGFVYVTNGTGLERYDSLPGYWSREDAIIAGCAATNANAAPRSSSGGAAGS
jgi:Spherulation-specific family 4